MAIELKVPSVGESISEVIIGVWMKKEGDSVEEDESVVELDTDKASQEIGAPAAGVIKKLLKEEGDTAEPGEVIAIIDENGAPKKQKKTSKKGDEAESSVKEEASEENEGEREASASDTEPASSDKDEPRVMPAARRLMKEHGLEESDVEASGPGGRILKEDVQKAIDEQGKQEKSEKKGPRLSKEDLSDLPEPKPETGGGRETETVRMTTLRRRIAERLVQSQQQAAILTTFNEIDMKPVMDLRAQYKESFQKKYGIKLGFMSFFVKACVDALREIPGVNARVEDNNIIYHNYQDIGVAVGGGKGLVVPVIRNAERLSFADIELTIADFGRRAQENQITPDEMSGGTFTISNGGIYGSMLSTPIINPPQSGILGMHNIVERPVVVNGEIVIRPIMYVALSYDHRLVDGREAVTFLKRIKECIEEPTRMLMEI